MEFQTDRLTVRPWQHEMDETLKADLHSILTPTVLTPLPPPMQLRGNVTDWMTTQSVDGTLCLIQSNVDQSTLGLLILAQPETALHIGYLFSESAWGKGYATELLKGLVAATSGTTLIGGVAKDNPASARVLLKAGFTRDPDLSDDTTDQFTRVL